MRRGVIKGLLPSLTIGGFGSKRPIPAHQVDRAACGGQGASVPLTIVDAVHNA